MSIDLNNLKTQLQTIFSAANTTTASRDLSNGLETRVQSILTVNPARIPVQSSWYPFVTIYIDSKEITQEGFVKDQVTAKRKSIIDVKVIGAVWNSTVVDNQVDPADDDCESLMENIEEILRSNPTIAGVATWSIPTNVTYHSAPIAEEASLRAGILNLQTTVFY